MAKTGRPKKPTNLKVLEGNPGKRQLPMNEPKPKPLAPECPVTLNREGKKMWKYLAVKLEGLGLLTEIDGYALAAACQSWGVYQECERYFRQKDPGTGKPRGRTCKYTNNDGKTNEAPRPEVKIGEKALDEFRAFCSLFGLAPAARAGLETSQGKGSSRLAGLLSG